jgi:hypothetical protein
VRPRVGLTPLLFASDECADPRVNTMQLETKFLRRTAEREWQSRGRGTFGRPGGRSGNPKREIALFGRALSARFFGIPVENSPSHTNQYRPGETPCPSSGAAALSLCESPAMAAGITRAASHHETFSSLECADRPSP